MQLKGTRSVWATLVSLLAILVLGGCAPGLRNNAAGVLSDRLLVSKHDHLMRAYRGDRLLREFHVALGRGGLAPKAQQGDHRVPEGQYFIAGRNPKSAYHLSLLISYPSTQQANAARAIGVDPGGEIMIHGLPNGRESIGRRHLLRDWTDGCIAVTNEEIEWLWRAVPDGTPIQIDP